MIATKGSKINRLQNKWTEHKIFELKYGNGKPSNVWKCDQVRSVPAVFVSSVCKELELNCIKQAHLAIK